MEMGLWDHQPKRQPIPIEQNAQAALQMAKEGIVLLKNEGNVLPLDTKTLKTIALIGPDSKHAFTGGGGSSHVHPAIGPPDPLVGLQKQLGQGVTIACFTGNDANAAAAAAKAADVAIVMVGNNMAEGRDEEIEPTEEQNAMVTAVAAANPKTIVVLKTGGPVLMPWVASVPAIMEAWYPGEMDAEAVAAVLTGAYNPSGKLPITFPKALADVPAHTPEQYPGVKGIVHYSEGVMVGYRWYDNQKIEPLFAFGHGLSYSTFAYDKLKLSDKKLGTNDPKLTVEFDITNKSGPAGVEVAQVYVGIPSLPDAPQPPQQLKGFARLSIAPGATGHATVSLTSRAFSHWDVAAHGWKVTPGDYPIYVGASSRDIRLKEHVTIE